MRAQPIRFTGMASGMDTDSIVRDLMRPQQMKVDREKKAQALLMLRQDAWKEMNKKLYDFHTNFTHKMSLESTFNKTVTANSNPNAISIDSGTTVPKGTHRFEVTQLAEVASVVGKVNGSKDFVVGAGASETIKINVSGVAEAIEVEVVEGDTFSSIATKMNDKLKDEGFTAKYDSKNGSFFISSNETGWGQTIEFNADTVSGKELLDNMGLEPGKVTRGKIAKYFYNGTEFTSATNKIEINGIKATLKAANAGEVITLSSEIDADAAYDFIKEFINEYNNLIDDLNEKLGTKPAKGYEPLTSEERESMSDSDIKLWEDKINKSLFYKDAQLEGFVSGARGNMGGVHANEYNDETKKYDGAELIFKSLSALGIVTGSWEEKGKLHIKGDGEETNPLKDAIANKPEDVMKFFTTLGKKMYDEQNKALQSSDLKSALNFYNDKSMDKQVKTHAKQIMTLEERMYKLEAMHYAKFAAMEKMLSSLNNQSSWLSQQFGG